MKNLRFYLLVLALVSLSAIHAEKTPGTAWLSNAVAYQIYPSSYQDSNGDGIGDLPGITSRLDYIKGLGVNTIWLNPIFVSGWFDGGYDVIDFYKVDPRFGTNTDLVNLVNEAHKRGIRVLLDLVAGHSSDQCEWFKQSASGTDMRYSDYYIWSDSIPQKEIEIIRWRDTIPDRLRNTKGKWVEANADRAKYYQKNYYMCQPALNYGYAHPNPANKWEQSTDAPGPQAMRRELRNIMTFWFDKGVDGFRVDMAASLVKEDKDKSAVKALWHEMRTWMNDKYPDRILVSEWSDPTVAIPAGFNIDFMIHIGKRCYPSLFFMKGTPWIRLNADGEAYFDRAGKGRLDKFIDIYAKAFAETRGQGYIAIPSANHDFQRPNVGTRNTLDQLKVNMMFYLTMPGVPFIYYGDEIAMKYQPDLPSKEGSRDRAGTRTPMQWTTGKNAGFSTVSDANQLYLPIDTENGKLTVEAAEKDPNSMLHYVRTLLKLRAENPALGNDADWQLLNTKEGQQYPMLYVRSSGNQRILIALNPTEKKVEMNSGLGAGKVMMCSGKGSYKNGKVTLNPFTALMIAL